MFLISDVYEVVVESSIIGLKFVECGLLGSHVVFVTYLVYLLWPFSFASKNYIIVTILAEWALKSHSFITERVLLWNCILLLEYLQWEFLLCLLL